MCDFFDKFCFILIGGNWIGIVICLRWHLIAGPKAEEDCPSDARDVLLTVSYSRLTLCCCCCCCWLLLLLISPKLPDAVWLCGIFYINVNTIFFFFKHKVRDMNGSTNPLLDKEEHVLKLGESFEKRPKSSFHTIRCECETPRCVLNQTLVQKRVKVLN